MPKVSPPLEAIARKFKPSDSISSIIMADVNNFDSIARYLTLCRTPFKRYNSFSCICASLTRAQINYFGKKDYVKGIDFNCD